MLYVLLAILLFGLLIFVHELGHFLMARLFKVTVNEFSIGMGPKLISKKSEKTDTAYSLRILPIGGFVSMEGEDESSQNSGAFCNKPVWQRMIITAAGAAFNILLGILVMTVIMASTTLVSNRVGQFNEGALSAEKIQIDDTIVNVAGVATHTANQVSYAVQRFGIKPVDVTVIRNGERVVLHDVSFPTTIADGHIFGDLDMRFYQEGKTVFTLIKHSACQSFMMIRLVFDSLRDLIVGEYNLTDLSGPIGIVDVVSQAAQKDFSSVWTYFVLLAMNLGVVNLLPFPALDGGRILFMLIEIICRRSVPKKVEAVIHTVGLALLMMLMLFVAVKDVINLF